MFPKHSDPHETLIAHSWRYESLSHRFRYRPVSLVSVFGQIMTFFFLPLRLFTNQFTFLLWQLRGVSYWLGNVGKDQNKSTKVKGKFGMSSCQDWEVNIRWLLHLWKKICKCPIQFWGRHFNHKRNNLIDWGVFFTNFHTVLLCLYLADPAFKQRSRDLIYLWEQLVDGNNTYSWVCIAASLIL